MILMRGKKAYLLMKIPVSLFGLTNEAAVRLWLRLLDIVVTEDSHKAFTGQSELSIGQSCSGGHYYLRDW